MQSVMESVFAHIEETEDRVFEIAYSLVHWIDKTYMNVDTEVPIETEMGNHFWILKYRDLLSKIEEVERYA